MLLVLGSLCKKNHVEKLYMSEKTCNFAEK